MLIKVYSALPKLTDQVKTYKINVIVFEPIYHKNA